MNHGGNIYRFATHLGCRPEQVLDFSANINPEQAADLASVRDVALTPYADPEYNALKRAFLQRYPIREGVDIEPFNGASAAIFALLRYLQPKDVVLYTPLYGEYAEIAGALGSNIHMIDRFKRLLSEVPANATVVFVNPSTPDGKLYDMPALLNNWRAANCTVIVDESFLDFCRSDSVAPLIADYGKLYVVKSLSKFYGCAGIRIGFLLGAASSIQAMRRLEPAWKLSSLDIAYMERALANTEFVEQTRRRTKHLRALLLQTLEQSALFDRIYPGQANFLLARLTGLNGHQLQTQLERSRILIRICDNFTGLDEYHVRFAVKDEPAIAILADSLKRVKPFT